MTACRLTVEKLVQIDPEMAPGGALRRPRHVGVCFAHYGHRVTLRALSDRGTGLLERRVKQSLKYREIHRQNRLINLNY